MIKVYVEIYGEDHVFRVSIPDDAHELVERYKDNPNVSIWWEWGPATQEVEPIAKEIDERIQEYVEDHS